MVASKVRRRADTAPAEKPLRSYEPASRRRPNPEPHTLLIPQGGNHLPLSVSKSRLALSAVTAAATAVVVAALGGSTGAAIAAGHDDDHDGRIELAHNVKGLVMIAPIEALS